jgi:hypothetical protein
MCTNEEVKTIDVVKPTDKYLSCKQLDYEIELASFRIRQFISQGEIIEFLNDNPACIVNTDFKIERGLNQAENRVDYLQTLKINKKC